MASNLIKIYIGRDVDCNYRISSIEISRKHALLEYCESQHLWTISDLNSTNGLYVNSVQLQPFSPYRLVIGDKVSFGPPNQSNFCYQFNDNSPVYELHAFGVTSIPLVPVATRDHSPSQQSLVGITTANAMPTRSGLEYAVNRGQRTVATTSSVGPIKKVMARKASADSTADRRTFVEHDYSLNSSAVDKSRKSKRLKLKDSSDSKAKALRMENERKYIAEEKKRLEKSKKSLERKKNIDQLKIKRKEEALRKKQKELERKEREAKKREEEIEKLRSDLLKEKKQLADKKQEQTKTDSVSSKRKTRSSSVRESDTKRQCKDNKVMEDLLESELTCSICSEYFIQAVNLNCSHTFCEHCIEEWKRTNNEETVCPICRHTIENQNRALVLDNLIDQFVTQTKPSLVEHRKKVAEERKKKMAKKVSHNKSNGSSARDRLSRFSNLIPSLQFFLRTQNGNNSSDSDTDDLSIININMDNFDSSSSLSSWSSDSSDTDSDDSSDDSSSSSSDDSVASSGQNSIASVRSVRSDHNYIDIDISSLYSSHGSANGSNDSNFSDSEDNSDVESLVSIRSDGSPRVEIEINSNESEDSDDSDFSIDD